MRKGAGRGDDVRIVRGGITHQKRTGGESIEERKVHKKDSGSSARRRNLLLGKQ